MGPLVCNIPQAYPCMSSGIQNQQVASAWQNNSMIFQDGGDLRLAEWVTL